MVWLKRIGFILVLPAMVAFFLHAVHPHAHAASLSEHDCAVCQVPTVAAKPSSFITAPTLNFTRYTFLHRTNYFSLPRFSPASPRAPPAA